MYVQYYVEVAKQGMQSQNIVQEVRDGLNGVVCIYRGGLPRKVATKCRFVGQ